MFHYIFIPVEGVQQLFHAAAAVITAVQTKP